MQYLLIKSCTRKIILICQCVYSHIHEKSKQTASLDGLYIVNLIFCQANFF